MSQESTNLDLIERARVGMEAFGRGDFDVALSFFTRDAVWDMKGGETFEGIAAIRAFFDGFYGQFESFAVEHEEIRDLGGEVMLVVNTMSGHPLGATVEVRQRGGFVIEGKGGFAERLTAYTDIDDARAAAERLAKERG